MALKQVSSTNRPVAPAENGPREGVGSDASLCASGVAVIETEARALTSLAARVDGSFSQACRLMLGCKGRVVVTGMGKSGHVGRKISSTLASAGTPSFFMHPGEASHGDLGMLTPDDVVLAISNSGGTSEIITILPLIKRLGVPLITLTGDGQSRMAERADVNIDVGVEEEACPLGLAPTASTTATLAMGDALAIALLSDPPLLVLDELTSNLDRAAQATFLAMLSRQRTSCWLFRTQGAPVRSLPSCHSSSASAYLSSH